MKLKKIPLEFNGNIEKDTIKVKSNDIEVVSIEKKSCCCCT